MLPPPAVPVLSTARPPTLPAVRRLRRPDKAARRPGRPFDPALRAWLTAPGSLTARLRASGPVQVQVMAQGTRRLWPAERVALGLVAGHVREVVLRVDGVPMVWARSVTTLRALKGPWRAVKGLGSRPLAELLFSHRRVVRGPLSIHHWQIAGPERGRARRHWSSLPSAAERAVNRGAPGAAAKGGVKGAAGHAAPRWARHSLFRHHGQPLRVLEAFSPMAARLLARR